jgi:trigger factor
MKIDLDVLGPVQRKIRVELPAAAVTEEFSRVYGALGERAKVKGFRPGKVPRSVLEGIYGNEVRGQVLSRLVESSLREAVKERGLEIVSRPKIETGDLEEGKGFAFSALVEVKPEIAVKSYRGLEVEKVKISVDEMQVEAALAHLRETHARLEPVQNRDTVDRGDFVLLDFVGFVDGKPLPGGKAENYLVEVGGGSALPAFEEAIVGLKKDIQETISVTYPEDYLKRELAGKAVEFCVTVREIKKKELPPIDDDFAKDYGGCGSLGELREKLRARLENELREMQSRELKDQLLNRVMDANPFEVPPAMVEQQARYLTERHGRLREENRLRAVEEPSPEQLQKDFERQARRQVQAMLLMERVAALEKIEVSEEDVRSRIEAIARSAGQKAAAVRELYHGEHAREDLRSQMVFERALDFLLERAKVKEVEPTVDAEKKKS